VQKPAIKAGEKTPSVFVRNSSERISPQAYASSTTERDGLGLDRLFPPFTKNKPLPGQNAESEPGPARIEILRQKALKILGRIAPFASAKKRFRDKHGRRLLAVEYYAAAYADLIGVTGFYLADMRNHDKSLLEAIVRYGRDNDLSYAETVKRYRLPPPLRQKADDLLSSATSLGALTQEQLADIARAHAAKQRRKYRKPSP
jgi:hypothetical protein